MGLLEPFVLLLLLEEELLLAPELLWEAAAVGSILSKEFSLVSD